MIDGMTEFRTAARPLFARAVRSFSALACALLFAAGVVHAPPAAAQTSDNLETQQAPAPRNGEQFEDWTLRCGKANEQAPESCEMFQQHISKQTDKVVLHAAVGKLPNSDQPGMLIVLPLGISLPPGVFIKVDEGEAQAVPVERCTPDGCRVELLLDTPFLNQLKAGTTLTVVFHVYDQQGERERVGVPVSLLGFTAALNQVLS